MYICPYISVYLFGCWFYIWNANKKFMKIKNLALNSHKIYTFEHEFTEILNFIPQWTYICWTVGNVRVLIFIVLTIAKLSKNILEFFQFPCFKYKLKVKFIIKNRVLSKIMFVMFVRLLTFWTPVMDVHYEQFYC